MSQSTPANPTGKAKEHESEYRSKYRCFRILIIGRANAGKTTILQKVCNTMEDPEIFDSNGKKASSTRKRL